MVLLVKANCANGCFVQYSHVLLLWSDLKFDLVVMRSEDSEQFATFLCRELTPNKPHKELVLFRYDDDVLPGSSEHSLTLFYCI